MNAAKEQITAKKIVADDREERALLTGLHVGLAVLYAACAFVYLHAIMDPSAPFLVPVGGDFINIWLAGKLVLAGHADIIYDADLYYRAQQEAFAPNIEQHTFPYPPFFLPVTAPFGLLPYAVAFWLWCGATFGLFVAAMRLFGRRGAGMVFLLALAPSSFVNVMAGQNGFLSAGLFVGALALLAQRPLAAGVLIGFLTYKPHLGFFIPLALALRRLWGSFAMAAAISIACAAAGYVLFGGKMTGDYIAAAAYQRDVLENWQGMLQYMMPSGFMAVRIVGGSVWLGYAFHLVMIPLCLVAVIRAWRKCDCAEVRAATILCATLVALPYVFNYDMSLASAAVVLLWRHRRGRAETSMLAALWLCPLLVVFLNAAGFPAGPLMLLGGLVVALRCAGRVRGDAAGAGSV